MNLIEQLGGYKEAKETYKSVCHFRESKTIDMPEINVEFDVGVLRCELLEYRREHDIFEKGDKIIFLALCNSVINYDSCLEMFTSQGLIRHATPSEITTGKRLN